MKSLNLYTIVNRVALKISRLPLKKRKYRLGSNKIHNSFTINITRLIVQNGKEEKMKIQEREEQKVAKENELEKRKSQQTMMQSAYLIVCEALAQSNRSTVSQGKFLFSKRTPLKISIFLFKQALIDQAKETNNIIGMDRNNMIRDLVIGNILHKNKDSSRKRRQERREFYLLLLLTDSIIYSH